MDETQAFINNFLKCNATQSQEKGLEFFKYFDKNGDSLLDMEEFHALVSGLFINSSADVISEKARKLLKKFDKNEDGKLDSEEFGKAWLSWFPHILDPTFALIIVDVQNDFISGSLALRNCPACEEAEEIVPVINRLVDLDFINLIVYTHDWHPVDHISFFENFSTKCPDSTDKVYDTVNMDTPYGKIDQILWPAHCVQNSEGAKLHKDLHIPNRAFHVKKGTNPNIDSYSAFFDNNHLEQTELQSILRKHNITHVLICGLATDVCVRYTTLDALFLGYRTALIEDACRGVNKSDIEQFKYQAIEQNVVLTKSSMLEDILKGDVRPIEWAIVETFECTEH